MVCEPKHFKVTSPKKVIFQWDLSNWIGWKKAPEYNEIKAINGNEAQE